MELLTLHKSLNKYDKIYLIKENAIFLALDMLDGTAISQPLEYVNPRVNYIMPL